MQMPTSSLLSVRIAVEPKRVLQTSPLRFVEVEKRCIKRYPSANAPTEIIATAASPFTLVLRPVRRSRTAAITVTGITTTISLVTPSTVATAIAPKATWESPSPMKENRLSTSVTPNSDDDRAISTPTTSAYRTKG